jgi:gamma-glutamylcyclotransferase (GGCT)/AIG2-like uncharacterized protein YtfP
MLSLFTYGTLQCEELMAALTGARLQSAPACLRDHRRGLLFDRNYPGIMPDAGIDVEGDVYMGLDPDALRLIDCFESDEYDRVEVTVELASGEARAAFAYVLRPSCRGLMSEVPWDLAAFREKDLERYVRMCAELRRRELEDSSG